MQRDMDLVRSILVKVSDSKQRTIDAHELIDTKHNFDEIIYHLQIMSQADLLSTNIIETEAGYTSAFAGPLTWKGNDFLDSVRSETIWNKVKQAISKTVKATSFSVIEQLAVRLGTNALQNALQL